MVLGVAVATALLALLLPRESIHAIDLSRRLLPPSWAVPLGTDELGRAVAWRLIFGSSISLGVACATVLVCAMVGTSVGLIAGERRGWVDQTVSRTVDLTLAFPGLLLAMALSAVLGPSIGNTVIALSITGWVPYARLARAEALRLSSREYVAFARATGSSRTRVLFRHLLPGAAPSLMVQGALHLAGAIMAESALSFLGLGVPPPYPSWGSMMAAGRTHLLDAPHLVVIPALAVVVTVLAANTAGEELLEAFDLGKSTASRPNG
jgi:peptide/nickel transport system permease protein